jgi:hypothetical protein
VIDAWHCKVPHQNMLITQGLGKHLTRKMGMSGEDKIRMRWNYLKA